MRIKVGDQVEVVSGEDRGLRGTVQRVIPKQNRIVVAGVNIVKKHQKAQQAGGTQTQGGIIEFEAPIDVSKVMVVDPDSDEPTRVGYRYEDGRKVRYAKKSGRTLD